MQGRPDDQGNMATREDLCKKGWKQDIQVAKDAAYNGYMQDRLQSEQKRVGSHGGGVDDGQDMLQLK